MASTSPAAAQKAPSVKLLGHCVFCLRKLKTTNEGLVNNRSDCDSQNVETVPRARLDSSVTPAFNLVWPWIQKYRKLEGNGGDDEYNKWCVWLNDPPNPTKQEWNVKEIKFQRVPSLCQACAEMVMEVERSMEVVKEQVILWK